MDQTVWIINNRNFDPACPELFPYWAAIKPRVVAVMARRLSEAAIKDAANVHGQLIGLRVALIIIATHAKIGKAYEKPLDISPPHIG